jgi:hypothetical protein
MEIEITNKLGNIVRYTEITKDLTDEILQKYNFCTDRPERNDNSLAAVISNVFYNQYESYRCTMHQYEIEDFEDPTKTFFTTHFTD